MRDPAPLPDRLTGRAFTRRDAATIGVPHDRLRRRDIRRPFHGVQLVGSLGSLRERCTAYALRLQAGQVFSHMTAVRLHGLPLPHPFQEELDLHVSATSPAHAPTTRGVAGHRLRIDPPVVDVGGLPVVRMDEAWAQMAPLLTVDELIELGDAVLWRDPGLLPAMRAAARTPYRPAGARLRRALEEIRVGSASPGETRVRLLLTRNGVPAPEINAEVRLRGGVVHPDLLWRDRRVLLEYEGDGHREREQFRYDVDRYELLRDAGWTVLRVTADDLRGPRAQSLIRRVRSLLA